MWSSLYKDNYIWFQKVNHAGCLTLILCGVLGGRDVLHASSMQPKNKDRMSHSLQREIVERFVFHQYIDLTQTFTTKYVDAQIIDVVT